MTLDTAHTWRVKFDGVDRSALVREGSLEWTTKEGREIDTCRFVMDDRADALTPAGWEAVLITSDAGTGDEVDLFGGFATVIQPQPSASGQWLGYEVAGEGYDTLFDRTPRVGKTYLGQTPGVILADLFAEAGLTPEFDVATYVAAGSALEVFTAAGEKFSATLDTLALQAGMVWYVDAAKAVHFAADDAVAEYAPFAVISPGTLADHGADIYEVEAGSLTTKRDVTGIVNRLTVVGGSALGAAVTDNFVGADKVTTSIGYAFNLTYQNIRTAISVKWNAAFQTPGTAFVDYFGKTLDNGETVDVLVSRLNGVVYFPLATVFDPADTISATYQVDELQTLVLDAANSAASAASHTKYGRYFDGQLTDYTITDQAEALEIGEAYLELNADVVVSGSFTVWRLGSAGGLRAGQSIEITSARDGLSGRYPIRRVDNQVDKHGHLRATVSFGGRAPKLGSYLGGVSQQEGPRPVYGEAGAVRLSGVLTVIDPDTEFVG